VPLVALGLLGAAVWFGTSTAPAPQSATPPHAAAAPVAVDPLPSWNDGPTKKAILAFVAAVTREGADSFVPAAERVAVFDHDGTLACEKPLAHGMFLVDRVRAMVERQPEMAHEEPFATLLTGDVEFVRKLGPRFITDLTFAVIAGTAEERLDAEARDFIRTAKHPVFDVPLGETTYQPMRELMALLKAKGFAIWLCSTSGVHFLRPAAEAWYGIGPERVIGSQPQAALREAEGLELREGESPNRRLEIVIEPEIHVLNEGNRKPVSIGERIGRRPIFAAGNVGTGGDVAMLRWSQSSLRPNLQVLVLHDDAEREMAYGEPNNASLTAAERYGWQVVRMASDWKAVFSRPLTKKVVAAQATAAAAIPPVASAEIAPPSPVIATPAEEPPPVRWHEEIAAFEQLDRESPPTPGGICLLGSSNVRMWTTLVDDFPELNVVNRGVGGCTLGELAEFGPRLVAAAKPRVIVVSAGTNDVAAGRTVEQIRDDFLRLAASLRQDLPDTTVAFLAIAPSIRRWDQLDRQTAANEAIRSAVEAGGPGLAYIDANAAFLGPDGRPAAECFLDDHQHPSTIGNSRRAALMRPTLERLLKE
jgi:lysophospholipase L1-like esterase